MTVYFCYILEFANKKIYVGMSRVDTKGRYDARYNQHAADARKNVKTNPIYRAWRKHGSPVQSIITTHTTREECAEAEIALIGLLDACNPDVGYNVQPGGQGMHAPPGSAMYEPMREKVWNNVEARRKRSEANKGKPPSPEAIAAANEWRASPEGRKRMKESWQNPERRAASSERTRAQMTPDARANISEKLKGRPDPLSSEGRERQRQAATKLANSGHASRMRAAAFANPETVAKSAAGLKAWRESEANAEHCRKIAKLAGEASTRPVVHVATGILYPSCKAFADAMGYSHQSYVSRLIAQGKVRHI